MSIIDIYITEVGRHLPSRSRGDIEAEIRSILKDMLEEQSRTSGKPIDDDMTFEVLKKFGSPENVAGSYQPERFLIGPKLFPSFLTVLQVVLPIVAALTLIELVPSFSKVQFSFENVFETIFTSLFTILGSLIPAFGSIVLIFTGVQWTVPEFKAKTKEWDPHSLLKIKPRDRIDRVDKIIDLIASLAAIIIFNFFPQLVSFDLSFEQHNAANIPIFSDTFFGYLPMLSVLWGLTVILDIVLVSQGRWQTWTRWFSFSLKIFSICVVIVMLAGPSLIAVNAEALTGTGMQTTTARILTNLLEQGTIAAMVISIIMSVVRLLRQIIRLTGKNLPEAWNRI